MLSGEKLYSPALGANATGQEKIKNPVNDPRYTGFLPEENSIWTVMDERRSCIIPCTSDSGPTSRGPVPKPIKKRDMGKIATV